MPSKSEPDEEIGQPLSLFLCCAQTTREQSNYGTSLLFEIMKGDFTSWDKVNAETWYVSQLNCKFGIAKLYG